MELAQRVDQPATAERGAAEAIVTDRYARRARLLVGLAMGLGLSAEHAADVVQEAHLRLWRELRSGTSIRDPDAWTTRVIYTLAMDQHRLQRRLGLVQGRLAAVSSPDPHETIEAVVIWQAVDRLPERERATLYLRYQADFSFDKIGQVLGVAESAARSYASRGLARLRARLSKEGDVQ